MGKDLSSNPCGGMGDTCPVHFHEDGPFTKKALPTSASTVYSDVFDYGESLSGICISAYADENIAAGAGVAIKLLAGDDKTAAGTDTGAWTEVKSVSATGTAAYAAGDKIFSFVPPLGAKKYYLAALTASGTGASGSISIWNELVPGR